ncbi:histone H4 transcription factor-like [Limulus polyphemus]|uniref:Histone H4 transcription factor-like n=1 Tax=Limulus polyphemus TaxID=6850 RepID=A0ABM1TK62_LIMPO|nr:histone H4 transcription factor-like [Limulus polyphemus]
MSNKEKSLNYVKFSWELLRLQCEWDDCTCEYEKMTLFLDHVNGHVATLSEDSVQCCWRDCKVVTSSTDELRRHVFFHAFHTKIKCFGQNFINRKKLPSCTLDHLSRNAIPELPNSLNCCWGNCENVYESPECFYRHVEEHAEEYPRGNNPKDPVKCKWQECDAAFRSLYKLKEHLRSHTQERIMACPYCGGMFSSRSKLQDHIHRQVSNQDAPEEEVEECGYCQKKFSSVRLLRDHMRHHVNQYKCPLCDMTCPTPSSLQGHIIYRHSEERPFSCQYCDSRCKRIYDLRKHMQVHNPNAVYECPAMDCDYSTRSNTCLNNHMRHEHEFNVVPSKMYQQDKEGYYRLQMVRYESIELSQSVLEDQGDSQEVDDPMSAMETTEDESSSQLTQTVTLVTETAEDEDDRVEVAEMPFVVYVQEDDKDKTTDSSVLVHLPKSEEDSLAPVIYLNSQQTLESISDVNKGYRTIQIVEQTSDGKTVLQTAHVLAEGSEQNAMFPLIG